jgi:cytochrome P450
MTMPLDASDNLDVDFSQMPALGNSWLERLDAIREADPVYWSKLQNGWIITRNADVVECFSGRLPLSAARFESSQFDAIPAAERAARIPLMTESIPNWIINADAPSHTRQRGLMMRAFSRQIVESLRPFARANIEAILDEAAERDVVEVNEDVARVMTGKTILRLLGVPQEYLPKLKGWAWAIANSLGTVNPSAEILLSGEAALKEMFDIFRVEIQKRREQPQQDVFTGLVQAVDGTARLTEDEMIGSSVVLLLAGHDTTLNSLTMGTEALSRRPELLAWIRENPSQINAVVVELSRHIAMASAQTRLAAADFEFHGKQIRKGDLLYLMIAAANRDPRQFKAPEAIDFARDNQAAVSFGPGLHHCVGHLLAKMQLAEYFTALVTKFESVEIVQSEIRFVPSFTFRGLERLDVRFKRR